MMETSYQQWLSRNSKLFFSHNGDVAWKLYNHALVPATIKRVTLTLDLLDAKRILRESGALFIRYSSEPKNHAGDWWYIYCDNYDPTLLSRNTRSKLSRGKRRCATRKMTIEELIETGYKVHKAAFTRYPGQSPLSKDIYTKSVESRKTGPFEVWGVWVADDLAGYVICALEDNEVFTEITRLHPEYLKYYTTYALFDAILTHYVGALGKTVNNGNRSVYHKTNMQQFLLKLGYKKQPCSLTIHYSLLGKLAAFLSCHTHALTRRFDNRFASIINGLAKQELIRRRSL